MDPFPSGAMEPVIACPNVFINEVGRHFPPCPSYDTLPLIGPDAIAFGVTAWLIAMGVLLLITMLAFSLTLATGD